MSDNGVNEDKKQKLRNKYHESGGKYHESGGKYHEGGGKYHEGGGKYHEGGGKEKARQYYLDNRDVIKEKARARYQNLSEE